MKIALLLSLTFFVCEKLHSQNFYFPPAAYSDSAVLEKNIPTLASGIIPFLTDTVYTSYFQHLSVLPIVQLAAKDYRNALLSLDKQLATAFPDTTLKDIAGFLYRTFILASEKADKEGAISLRQAYEAEAKKAHQSLSEKSANALSGGIMTLAVSPFEDVLQGQLQGIRNSGRDSISLQAAAALCDIYTTHKLYVELLGAGKEIFASQIGNYHIEDSALITMPDGGIVSATIVKKKEAPEKQPVVMLYNIYPQGDKWYAAQAADKGYVGVVVNTRGKRLSPDSVLPFETDAEDAWYIIDWVSKQSWSNGKVGMYGGSYLGFSQWSATKNLHPALKTIIPMVAVGPGIDYPNQNGIFMSYMLRWIHYVTNNKLIDAVEFADSAKWNKLFARWYQSGASYRSLDSLDRRPSVIFQRWLDHPSYDSYWQNMTPQKEEFSKINIPVLTTTGYYDDDQLGAFHYYREHLKWNPDAKNNHYLLIGPYDHGGAQGYPDRKLVNYAIDSVANISIFDLAYKWFDYVLKDSARPAILKDKVNFQVMGKNEWRHVPSLDKMNNDTLTFYLAKGSRPGNNKYKLEPGKPPKRDFISQIVDLKDRSSMRFEDDALAGVDRVIDSIIRNTPDEMIFISDPLAQPVEINGSVIADVFASVNKKDIDLVMYLFVQEPDGKFFYLNRNLQRASLSKDKSKRQLLRPGKTENIKMQNNFFTSKLVEKGSRIVITLGINKAPGWQVNYGTGKDVSDETIADGGVPLQIKWYNNSTVKIPVWR